MSALGDAEPLLEPSAVAAEESAASAPLTPQASGDPAWASPPLGASEWIVGLLAFGYTQLPIRNTIRDVAVFGTVSVLAMTLWRGRLPERPRPKRRGWAEAWLVGLTLLSALVLIGVGVYREAPALRAGTALLVLACYFPFALLQEWVTLRYLVQRFAGRLAKGRSLPGAVLGGVLFGLCHLPFPVLLFPTLVSGVLWALAWRAGARLWLIATSHALLGALLFVSVIDKDPFAEVWALFGA